MAEGVKKRQSLSRQSLSLSPRKREGGFSLLAPNHASTHRPSRILIEEDNDHDEEMGEDKRRRQEESSTAPETPHMSDLRHMFGRPQNGGAGTPTLAGVREMFRPQPQGPVETPRMDGLQEMLGTPAEYRAPPPENEEEKEEEVETVVELPARNARGKRTPAARTRRTPVPQSAPAKSTRASSQALEEPEHPDGDAVGARRTRARTADGAVGQVCDLVSFFGSTIYIAC